MKNVKIALPLTLKNVKNGVFLRVCGRKMVGGAVKMVFFVSGWVGVCENNIKKLILY